MPEQRLTPRCLRRADNKPPTRYKHLFQNLKKAQLEDGAPPPPRPDCPSPQLPLAERHRFDTALFRDRAEHGD